MRDVSAYLADKQILVSRNQVEAALTGRRERIRAACDELSALGHAKEVTGARRSRLMGFVSAYQPD